jgi:DNA-binding NarL/FixJ family response regulator
MFTETTRRGTRFTEETGGQEGEGQEEMITTPAIAAAFRLATQLPVHTHERRALPPASAQTAEPQRLVGLRRRQQVRGLLAQKLSQRTIAERLGVSRTTVFNHVCAIKAERRR